MVFWLELGFWLGAACVVYTYVAYPLLAATMAWLRGRPVQRRPGYRASVSVVIAARNEEANIARRIREFLDLIETAGVPGEIIVVSDGSTDRTVEVAREREGADVRILDLAMNVGKAAALSQACALARYDIIVFADTRQTWAP